MCKADTRSLCICTGLVDTHPHVHTETVERVSGNRNEMVSVLHINTLVFLIHQECDCVSLVSLVLHVLHILLHVCVCACARVLRIMACLFICRLTPVRPLLLIRAPASLFRSPPSWLVMKTLLLKRQVLCLKASNALCSDFTGGHIEAYPISMTGINCQIPLVVSPNQHVMSFCLSC